MFYFTNLQILNDAPIRANLSKGRDAKPPVLLELAATRPGEVVSVIVQEAMTDSSVEERVARLGGTVTRDLPIINAITAELQAQAVLDLASAEGVRWVSLDAPVTRVGDPSSPDDQGHPPTWNETVLDLGHSRNPPMSHCVHNKGWKNESEHSHFFITGSFE